MTRLAISVEGQTEEEFVRRALSAHLRERRIDATPVLIGRARRGAGGGGNVTMDRLAKEMRHLKHSFDAVTSLVDFYGFRSKRDLSPEDLVLAIGERIGDLDERLVFPYVQVHEFEGLLFSNVDPFAAVLPETPVDQLRAIRVAFETPEDINDGATTAPSKRIKALVPRYRKTLDGPELALGIGLETIRAECPRFDSWMRRLESLGERAS